MVRARILVASDDSSDRKALCEQLSAAGHRVAEAREAAEALAQLSAFAPEAVLVEAQMPGALGAIRRAREQGVDAPFLVFAPAPTVQGAVDAIAAGAVDYLGLQEDPRPLLAATAAAIHGRRARAAAPRRDRAHLPGVIGMAPELIAASDTIRRAAATDATVLILGESGSGKDLFARCLHECSSRKDGPFVAVSCASLTPSLLESEIFGHEEGSFTGANGRREGRLESASGGTLYLDEIADVPPSTQVKLRRALQQREFERVGGTETVRLDARIVAASKRDLAEEVRAGRFREDLFYRLDVVSVQLPPLRRRKGDIPALVNHFLEAASRAHGKQARTLAPAARAALLAYDWPGNVRELENVVERAVVLCKGPEVTLDELPASLHGLRPSGPIEPSALMPGLTFADIEREAILRTLQMVGGSTARAAEVLGISIRKIQYRMKEYASEAR
jgi:two-component system NtrC family response regulator/two-component system response regulator HydG